MLDIKKDYLIFDADCGFCQRGIDFLKNLTKDAIEYIPSNTIENGFYGIDKDSLNSSIKFFEHRKKQIALNDYEKVQRYDHHDIHEDAIIYHGAYAIFKALSSNTLFKPLLFIYEHIPLINIFTEAAYRIIARNRALISKAIGADLCKIN